MNKILMIAIVGLVLSCGVYFYLDFASPNISFLDMRFNSMVEEVGEYGGGIIYSYDTETGEITGKRRVGEQKEEGIFSVIREDHNKAKDSLQKKVVIVESLVSPLRAVEWMGGNK